MKFLCIAATACSFLLATSAFASSSCKPIEMVVMNHSSQMAQIIDASGTQDVAGNGSHQTVMVKPGVYYHHDCRSISIKLSKSDVRHLGIVPAQQEEIHVRINKDGTIDSDLGQYGFQVNQVMPYTGLEPFVS